VKLIQSYRAVVEKELDEVCGEILGLLDQHLVPSATTVEASVFYLKMKADYHRYLAEFKVRRCGCHVCRESTCVSRCMPSAAPAPHHQVLHCVVT
jgi:hypothetical protein